MKRTHLNVDGREGSETDPECLASVGLKLVCAWHEEIFGSELVMRDATQGHDKDGVSHGICEACRRRIAEPRR